jgi:hypothetical protein
MTEKELYTEFYVRVERWFDILAQRINDQGFSFVQANAQRKVSWSATAAEQTTLILDVVFWTHAREADSLPVLRADPRAENRVQYEVQVGKLTLDIEEWGHPTNQRANLPLLVYHGALAVFRSPDNHVSIDRFLEESINTKLWDLHTRGQTLVVGLKLT